MLDLGRGDHFERCAAAAKVFGFVLTRRLETLRAAAGPKTTISGLWQFDADKTIRLLDKAWEHRGAAAAPQRGRLLNLPINRNYNDQHGHRAAFSSATGGRGEDAHYTPVLEFMRRLGPSVLVEETEHTRWGEKMLVRSQVSSATLAPLVKKGWIDEADISFLERFGRLSGELDENEVIALGRHETSAGTTDSLLWEFGRWIGAAEGCLKGVESYFSGAKASGTAVAEDVWKSWSLGLECRKKAGIQLPPRADRGDFTHYKEGLRKLNLAAARPPRDDELAAWLEKEQADAEGIWDTNEVGSLGLSAFACYQWSAYVAGTLARHPAFEETVLPNRVAILTDGEVETASKDLARLVVADRGIRPAQFTYGWWERQPLTVPEDGVLPTCDAMVREPAARERFVGGCKNSFARIADQHIRPDIRGRVTQRS